MAWPREGFQAHFHFSAASTGANYNLLYATASFVLKENVVGVRTKKIEIDLHCGSGFFVLLVSGRGAAGHQASGNNVNAQTHGQAQTDKQTDVGRQISRQVYGQTDSGQTHGQTDR